MLKTRNRRSTLETLEPRRLFTASAASAVITPDGTGITGEYFIGNDFQTPIAVRSDKTIAFNWINGRPEQDIPAATVFSVKWTGQIEAATTGTYKFYTQSDSGTNVIVNGVSVISNFASRAPSTQSGSITLTAGEKYSIEVDYVSRGKRPALMRLFWSTKGVAKEIVPKSSLFLDPSVSLPTASEALVGTYYLGYGFKDPVLTRADPKIWFDWAGAVPDTVITPDRPFSVRWLGNITAPTTGTYYFRSVADDGVRIWVNGKLIINNPYPDNDQPHYGSIVLQAGVSYQFREDYTNDGDDNSSAALYWALPNSEHFSEFVPFSLPAPTAPTGLTANVVSASQIELAWSETTAAASFVIERSSNGGASFTQIATVPAGTDGYTDNAVAPDTTYEYEVIATDSAGSSTPSNLARASTPLAAPINLAATVQSASQIDLSWNDVTGETGFNVLESTSATGPFTQVGTTPAGTTTFDAAGLSAATPYYFEIVAVASPSSQDSSPSTVATATTSPANPSYATLTTLYGLTANGRVYSINTTTGADTQIGTLAFGTEAAGRDPYSSNFFYISTASPTAELAEWNPFDGQNTIVDSSVSVGSTVALAAFRADGTFFFTDSTGDLYSLNVDNNAETELGTLHVNGNALATGSGDIAFSPNGTLFIESSSELYSVTPAALAAGTGVGSIITATDLGPTNSAGNLQIAFGQNGVLFGNDASGQLYSLSTTTGNATQIGSAGTVGMNDLASIPLYSELTVTQAASSFVAGSTGSYTLTVNNAGPDDNVGAITMVDTLPTGVTYVSGTGTGWTFSINGQTLTMTYTANVNNAASAPPAVVNVAIGSAVTGSVTNAVTVTSSIFQTNTASNSSSLTTPVT